MGEIKWTPSQRAAIDTRGRNILVSAAAGSGKTAVLVERIINRIMRDRSNTDIDRMLIVTFTNAAAAEMKEKINKRLRVYTRSYRLSERKLDRNLKLQRAASEKTLEQVNQSRYEQLRRRRYEQMSALDDADICTIDSFCKKCVQSFAHELDISPDFRLYDPDEDALVIEETAARLIDKCYEEAAASADGSTAFTRLTECYSSMNSDRGLINMLTDIYGFIQSYAEPLEKLDELFGEYGAENEDEVFGSRWARELMREQRLNARRILNGIWKNEGENAEGGSVSGLAAVFGQVMLSLCGIEADAMSDGAVLSVTAAALSGNRELLEGKLKEHDKALSGTITEGGELNPEARKLIDFTLSLKPEERLSALCEKYREKIKSVCGEKTEA